MRDMRRNAKIKNSKDVMQNKIVMYSIIGVSVLIAILVGLLIYSKNVSENMQEEIFDLGNISNETNNSFSNNTVTESASTEIGKSVNEALNETLNETNSVGNTVTNTISEKSTNTTSDTSKQTTSTQKETTESKSEKEEETKKELAFGMPVEGEIMKAYAKDNLLYSETLQEWTTHLGIDIKAEKTTVIKASEAGRVKTIKNDPRYGLTITIEHDNGYQTVYANLLSSEFVIEGEKVEKGQSIGTVGNTASFEIADEPHLHFEILKDGVQVDPTTLIK